MEFEEITVWSRDEYRTDQEPAAFSWRGDRIEVAEVLDRWYEGYTDSTRFPMRYFRVRTAEGDVYLLRFHEFFRRWSIVVPRGGQQPRK